MAGRIINTYTQLDTDILALQLTEDASFVGKHNISLTNYDTTGLPAIAAGSIIECNGALAEFESEEAITGSPSNGTVYIQIVPSTTTATAQFTNTAPTWSDAKQGFYGTGAAANYRYLEFEMYKYVTSYSNKKKITHDDNVKFDILSASSISASGNISADNILTTGGLSIAGDITIQPSSILSGGYVKSPSFGSRYTSTGAQTANAIFDSLVASYFTYGRVSGQVYNANGIIKTSTSLFLYIHSISYSETSNPNNVRIYGVRSDTFGYDSIYLENGDTTNSYILNVVF